MAPAPMGSSRTAPDVMSFLLLVAAAVLLACTIYLLYLGCAEFGAGAFFRNIYSTERIPDITVRAGHGLGTLDAVGLL